jgi:hypothetical protein
MAPDTDGCSRRHEPPELPRHTIAGWTVLSTGSPVLLLVILFGTISFHATRDRASG